MKQYKMFSFTCCLAAIVLTIEAGMYFSGFKIRQLWWVAFFMPILWTLWVFHAFTMNRKEFWRLILLWALIDLAALSVSMAVTTNHGGRNDSDYLLVLVFSPLIFPALWLARLSPLFSNSLSNFLEVIEKLALSSNASSIFYSWLGLSILSIFSVFFIFSIISLLKLLANKLKHRNA